MFECLIASDGDDHPKAILREWLTSPPAYVTNITYQAPRPPFVLLERPTVVTSSTGDDARSSVAWTGAIPLRPYDGVSDDLAKLVRIQASTSTRY
jgi:hypothetical protein